jgi:hypothetical protein
MILITTNRLYLRVGCHNDTHYAWLQLAYTKHMSWWINNINIITRHFSYFILSKFISSLIILSFKHQNTGDTISGHAVCAMDRPPLTEVTAWLVPLHNCTTCLSEQVIWIWFCYWLLAREIKNCCQHFVSRDGNGSDLDQVEQKPKARWNRFRWKFTPTSEISDPNPSGFGCLLGL